MTGFFSKGFNKPHFHPKIEQEASRDPLFLSYQVGDHLQTTFVRNTSSMLIDKKVLCTD